MKRILLTVHKFFPAHRAGTEVLTLKIAQELKRRAYEVLVLTANPPCVDARRKDGPEATSYQYQGVNVRVVEEPLRLKNYSFHSEYCHDEIGRYVATLLEEFRPDVLHVIHAQNLSGSIIAAARKRGIPVVASPTDFWFVCPIVQLKRPDGSVCRGPGVMAANCLTCYTPKLMPPLHEFVEALAGKYPQLESVLDFCRPLKSGAVRAAYSAYAALKLPEAISATVSRPVLLRDLANSTQAIMVPTKLMRDIFIENGISPGLIRHVPFGLDTAPLIAHQEKTACDEVRFGFIGTLFEHKGVDLLVRAFQDLPVDAPARLVIYGDVEQFPEYSQQLTALATSGANSKKITFAGTFPNERLGAVLSGIDVLVVPSRWYENTPLVIQSALATKTPLIVTDLPGMSELVKHEVNGLVFPLNDAGSLKQQLLRVVNDRELIVRFRDNIGPQRTIADMVDDIEAAYRFAEQHVPPKEVSDVLEVQA